MTCVLSNICGVTQKSFFRDSLDSGGSSGSEVSRKVKTNPNYHKLPFLTIDTLIEPDLGRELQLPGACHGGKQVPFSTFREICIYFVTGWARQPSFLSSSTTNFVLSTNPR